MMISPSVAVAAFFVLVARIAISKGHAKLSSVRSGDFCGFHWEGVNCASFSRAQAGIRRTKFRRKDADQCREKKKEEEVVAPGRVELPTFGLGNRCSIHLSYGATATNNYLI
jgi:hypothetical protein